MSWLYFLVLKMASNFKLLNPIYFAVYFLFPISLIFFDVEPVKATEDICQLVTKSKNIDKLIALEQDTDIEQSLNEINCYGENLWEVAFRHSPYLKYTSDIRPERYDHILWLVNNNLDINKTEIKRIYLDEYFSTPLFAAISSRKNIADIVYLLLANKAKANNSLPDGQTPLYKAINRPFIIILDRAFNSEETKQIINDSLKIIKYLLKSGADLNVKYKGRTIEEIISEYKKSSNQNKAYFGNQVDLLLEKYR